MSAEQTRERILEAACDLIAAEGIDDVRIARVANRAGASTALVHHYFSTREDLLTEALAHAFELAAEERFGEEVEVERSASAALAAVILQCLPEPGARSASGCCGWSSGFAPLATPSFARSPPACTGATTAGPRR